ncbi:MFS transporter [Paenibacillus silvae]|uniref:MFS transporter n=1 Tax=Paenibacillus silvae TaxID=1325358 RepID=UPI002005CABE|nr:MFS transporter [Paenibacillus silvae]MCK6074137.1 MFS transporter [Paenibacillus silvae]MCK6148385.1 MFS transporter [Paenibacillus silvae]MCK6266685.1 MFS transporter [Paenibacillus silvae]
MKEQSAPVRLWTTDFILLMLCNFLLFLQLHMIVSPLPSYVQDRFHANAFQVSLFTCLFALSAIAARLYSAKALEKGLRNAMIYIGLSVALLATLGYYFAAGIAVLLLLRMLFGVGFGMSSTAFPTMASDIVPVKRMGEGMGYFGLSTSLAMSMGPIIGVTLLQGAGFVTLMVCTAAVIVVIYPLSYSLTRKKAARTQQAAEPAAVTVSVAPSAASAAAGKTAFNRKLILPSVLNGLLSITYGGLVGFIVLFGKEAHLANPALFFLFNAMAVLVVRPFAGRIYDSKGPKALLIPGAVCIALGLVILSTASTMPVLFAAAFMYGIGYGSMQSSLQTWMIQVVSPAQRGMANGMFLNTLDLGIATGALLLGSIASLTSYTEMYRYSILFMVLFLLIYLIQGKRSGSFQVQTHPLLSHTHITASDASETNVSGSENRK